MPTNLSDRRCRRPSIMAVAVDHHHHSFKPPIGTRHCRLRSFHLPQPKFLEPDPVSPKSPSFCRSFSTPCLSRSAATPAATNTATEEPASGNAARIEIVGGRRASGVHALIVEAAVALVSGAQLVPVSHGLSGAYYLHNRHGVSFAVIKPVDTDSSPFDLLGRTGARHSVHAGDTGAHEVAAYLLDHGGFSGVPPTALIKISHPNSCSSDLIPMLTRKLASIHRFVPHDFDAGEIGPSMFTVASVHRIGILDLRLMNVDRHAGNMLVRRKQRNNGSFDSSECYSNDCLIELVPIDHGLCLPEILDDPYFEWLHWSQASVPFSETEIEYVAMLDPFRDADLLRTEIPGINEASIRILILCTIFLKRAVEAGLSLADIGHMMTREFSSVEEGSSILETICKKAEKSMQCPKIPTVIGSCNASANGHEDEVNDHYELDIEQDIKDNEILDDCSEDVLDIPLLWQTRGRCNMTISSEDEEGEENDIDEKYKMIKSISFSAAEFNHEVGNCISFRGLSEDEWMMFLKRFEQLLPEAFEERKRTGLLKQSLKPSISCKF